MLPLVHRDGPLLCRQLDELAQGAAHWCNDGCAKACVQIDIQGDFLTPPRPLFSANANEYTNKKDTARAIWWVQWSYSNDPLQQMS